MGQNAKHVRKGKQRTKLVKKEHEQTPFLEGEWGVQPDSSLVASLCWEFTDTSSSLQFVKDK